MMDKLMMLIMHTLTGHRIWLVFCLVLISMSGCWLFFPDEEDYKYSGYLVNSTSDSLVVLQGTDTANYGAPDTIFLPPNSAIDIGGKSVDEGEDPIRDVYLKDRTRAFLKQTRVYRAGTLVTNWIGPPREMADSIHHFYNYNSWEYWLEDDTYGVIQFTIYESDFENN